MNIPPSKLDDAKTIMLVGIGGGFDVFTGLPFVFAFPDKNFVLVNSSPKDLFLFRKTNKNDYPESEIEARPNILEKYTVARNGVGAVKKAYEAIAVLHPIDLILSVDGGVDSLAIGNEENPGTILEDFIGLAALKSLPYPKIHCCAGFGTETEEDVNHYRILENIAAITAEDGFLGSFSLTKQMPEFAEYVAACEKTWEGKRKSHIQTKIISAAKGGFKNNLYSEVDARVFQDTGVCFVSPLSSIYWLFDFDAVARRNQALEMLSKGNTLVDCKLLLKEFLKGPKVRDKRTLPL